MHEFIAHYIDFATGKEYTEKIDIDCCGLDSECMNHENESLFAWKQAVTVAIEHNRGSLVFSSIELLSE